MTDLHVVFQDDLGNEEQRSVVDGHIVALRLFDRNAFYTLLFRAVEQAIALGRTAGTLPSRNDNPFHHWKLTH